MTELLKPPAVDLAPADNLQGLAALEGLPLDSYVCQLADVIAPTENCLDVQVDRFRALASLARCGKAEARTASELAGHYIITNALFERWSHAAFAQHEAGRPKGTEIYSKLAIQASGASLAILSALKVLRDSPLPPARLGHGQDPDKGGANG